MDSQPKFYLNPVFLEQLEKLKLEDNLGTGPSSENPDDCSSNHSQESLQNSIQDLQTMLQQQSLSEP